MGVDGDSVWGWDDNLKAVEMGCVPK